MVEELTIWCNAKLPAGAMERLKKGVAEHRLVIAEKVINNVQPCEPDVRLLEADIAFGQPDTGQVIASQRLKWVQLSSAGYARYDKWEVREALAARGAMLSNASAVYAEACAEHAMAFILAGARQLPAALDNQRAGRGWPAAALRGRSKLLAGESVLIVGFGAIGRRLAELIAPLGMKVTGVRRKVQGGELVATHGVEKLDRRLPEADHVVNILPAGAGNDGFFDAAKFSRMKPGAYFYNIGRGATVNQTALAEALQTGQVGAAFLDVTDPEPLPAGDPLWTAKNCLITPHTAGGAADEFDRVVEHFLGNLKRWLAGEALRDRVY